MRYNVLYESDYPVRIRDKLMWFAKSVPEGRIFIEFEPRATTFTSFKSVTLFGVTTKTYFNSFNEMTADILKEFWFIMPDMALIRTDPDTV